MFVFDLVYWETICVSIGERQPLFICPWAIAILSAAIGVCIAYLAFLPHRLVRASL
jgi:hypothetical protein